jgi:hypothetical protein
MEWIPVLTRSGLALVLLRCAVIGYVIASAIAAMVAIWHPDSRRRSAALKVLELLLSAFRPGRQFRRLTESDAKCYYGTRITPILCADRS